MKILYIGPDYPGSNGACWRDAFDELGHETRTVNSEIDFPAPKYLASKIYRKILARPALTEVQRFNRRIDQAAREFKPSIIFYIQGRYVLPESLELTRRHGKNFVYMNDDMFNPANQSFTFKDAIRQMDCVLTTKSYNVSEFHQAGAPYAVYIPNAYDPKVHFPSAVNSTDLPRYSGDIVFIGTFRSERADYLSEIKNAVPDKRLNIWGGGWDKARRLVYAHKWNKWGKLLESVNGKELWCGEMGKAFQSNKICLGLLNHANRDLHTSRSFEIPACGGFMLAERTIEHQAYFEEDREAVYFGSFEELIDKLRFYITHETPRKQIAQSGYERCLRSDYKYIDRAKFAFMQYEMLS